MVRKYKPICCRCGEVFSGKAQSAGYHLCPTCRTETPTRHRADQTPATYRDWNNESDVMAWAIEKGAEQ